MLLEAGDPNEDRSLELHLALGHACDIDFVRMMYLLLEHGAQVQRPGEEPIIHRILSNNNIEVISTLIARGADIEGRNSNRYTPLMKALFFGLYNQTLALLAAGKSFPIFTHPGVDVNIRESDAMMEILRIRINANPYLADLMQRIFNHQSQDE